MFESFRRAAVFAAISVPTLAYAGAPINGAIGSEFALAYTYVRGNAPQGNALAFRPMARILRSNFG